MFAAEEIHKNLTRTCRKPELSSAFSGLLAAATPFPPSPERNLTLSLVTILTPLPRVVERFRLNLQLLARLLEGYPDLPFEIVICFGKTKDSDPSFWDLVPAPVSLESKLRILNLNPGFAREFGSPNFPEYIARNVAIRRSRGEFIISCSSDVIPHFSLFDAILHRQFTAFTLFRSPRTELKNFSLEKLLQRILDQPTYSSQVFALPGDRNGVIRFCEGDFQGCHYSIWALIRGYVENDCTFHVDSRMSLDVTIRMSTVCFRKTFTKEYHLQHHATSWNSHHLDAWKILSGTDDEWFARRRTWGYAGNPSLPPVVF
jgi:hypothetical protein